jgi:hypothetical protein
MSYQLVPPHCHRTNAAERAIRTFNEHFKSGLDTVDPAFPIHLWDRLLPQAEITLNLLRSSRLHPQLSAAAHYHGLIDYNRTAFGSPGCKIIAHEKTSQRRTWAAHGQPGWSLGAAMHHYGCQNVYITSTASERIVDTLDFSYAAERAIRTFKEHFKSGLDTVDLAFPIHLWDILLPQAEITLKLLRSSRLHPRLSAAAHYHGLVD